MVRRELIVVSAILMTALCARVATADVLIGLAAPITGKNAWFGEQLQRGAELAMADLNAAGGVLGQQVELITADDYCAPDEAVAAANKLVSDGVIFVVGHMCSGAAVPASKIWAVAGVLMISPMVTNPKLTEQGFTNVFRLAHRDDATAIAAGNYLADHWSDKNIAILHDDTIFGIRVAELTKEQLNRRGLTEAIYLAYVPGKVNSGVELDQLQAADIAVAFIGGYHTEIGLMARHARDRGYPLQLVATTLGTEEFGLIAGAAADGALFIDQPDPRRNAEAAPVVERFRALGYEPEHFTLYAYGAVQVWAQAAEKAGSLELEAMVASLRQHQFDTVLGPIDFDDKGDLTVQKPVWWVWRGGSYAPLE